MKKIVVLESARYYQNEPDICDYAAYKVLDDNLAIKVADRGKLFSHIRTYQWDWDTHVGDPVPLDQLNLMDSYIFCPNRTYRSSDRPRQCWCCKNE